MGGTSAPRRGVSGKAVRVAILAAGLALAGGLVQTTGAAQAYAGPGEHAPYPPRILSFTADPQAPFTRFYTLLEPFAEPDGDPAPTVTEWRVTGTDGTDAYRTTAAAPPGSPPDLLVVAPGVLKPAHAYTVTLRHMDRTGLWSAWSPAFPLVTARTDPADLDGDGLADRAEPAATARAAPLASAGETVFLEAEAGRTVSVRAETGTLGGLTVMRADELPAAGRGLAGSLPYGLFGIRVEAPAPGASVGLTFELPEAPPAGLRWLEAHPARGPEPVPAPTLVAGRTVTVAVVDGGPGDADGVANGVVASLSGPVLPGDAPPLPPAPAIDTASGTDVHRTAAPRHAADR